MTFKLAFASCTYPIAPVRFDSMVAQGIKAFYMMGDMMYMDGLMGLTASPLNGLYSAGVLFYPGASGLSMTTGTVLTENGVTGQVPLGAITITSGGTGNPPSATYPVFLNGGNHNACVVVTTNGSGVVTSGNVIAGGDGYSSATAYGAMDQPWQAGYWKRRMDAIMSMNGWVDLQDARANGKIKAYIRPDDHEWANNWDNTVTKAAQLGISTTTGVVDYLRLANPAIAAAFAPYSDFVPTVGGKGDIPTPLVGAVGSNTVAFTNADVYDWTAVQDYDDLGNVAGSAAYTGKPVIRVIVIDGVMTKGDQTATDNAGKYMIGPNNEAWLDTKQAEAVALGVKAIWILSDKDPFNVDNSDGWCSYTTQRERILTNIQTKGYPSIWISGDRHCAHAAACSTANGDAYDHLSVCATPFGATLGYSASTAATGNTPYKQMIWQNTDKDQIVHGVMTWDSANQQSIFQVVNNSNDREKFAAFIPAGARKAAWTRADRSN